MKVQFPKLRSGSFFPESARSREGHQRVSIPAFASTGVSIDGTREVLGTEGGDSESPDFWREFLTGLKARDCRMYIWCLSASKST